MTVQRPRDGRNARGRATARRIATAAVDLALEHGLDGLTVDAVCEQAGVSQRTFFHHFATKEDALLDLDLPEVDEEAARRYLSDPGVPVLAGAVRLVRLPVTTTADPVRTAAHLQLIATSPALLQRQSQRLMPLLHEVRELVRLKLRATTSTDGSEVDEAELARQADLVTTLGAALVQRVGSSLLDTPGSPVEDPERLLESLRPIWSRLV